MNYPGGKQVRTGDLVMHKSWTTEVTTYEKGKRTTKTVPLVGEVVPVRAFFNSSQTINPCVIFHQPSIYGFHTHTTLKLPRENGGCAFVDVKALKFLRRGVEGQSVFDAAPEQKKRRRDYDEE